MRFSPSAIQSSHSCCDASPSRCAQSRATPYARKRGLRRMIESVCSRSSRARAKSMFVASSAASGHGPFGAASSPLRPPLLDAAIDGAERRRWLYSIPGANPSAALANESIAHSRQSPREPMEHGEVGGGVQR